MNSLTLSQCLNAVKNHLKFLRFFIFSGAVGALSLCVSLLMSPLTVSICKRKSTRITAVVGGLVLSLGCLFTSFASQFHQIIFSYGFVVGVGVSFVRDPATLMVGQYFKRKREGVEIVLVSASGAGLSIMSHFLRTSIRDIGKDQKGSRQK